MGDACDRCLGIGTVRVRGRAGYERIPCPRCGGSGTKHSEGDEMTELLLFLALAAAVTAVSMALDARDERKARSEDPTYWRAQ